MQLGETRTAHQGRSVTEGVRDNIGGKAWYKTGFDSCSRCESSQTCSVQDDAELLQAEYPKITEFIERLQTLVPLTAPWLMIQAKPNLVPTHVKQLRTSAPKDAKEAREARKKGKLVAKSKQKDKRHAKIVLTSSVI